MPAILVLIVLAIMLYVENIALDFFVDFLNRKLPSKSSPTLEDHKKEMTMDINRSHRDFMKVQRGELSEREYKDV